MVDPVHVEQVQGFGHVGGRTLLAGVGDPLQASLAGRAEDGLEAGRRKARLGGIQADTQQPVQPGLCGLEGLQGRRFRQVTQEAEDQAGRQAQLRLARPTPPLDEAAARTLLGDDFPEAQIDRIWLAGDGSSALARSGAHAFYLFRLGDSWVARDLPWTEAAAAPVRDGRLHLRLAGVSPRLARPVLAGWPPETA